MSNYQEKNHKAYQKAKNETKQFEETEQVWKPDMTEMLKWSGQEFKTIMTNMLKDSNWQSRTNEQYKQRDGHPKEEQKRNATDQKHCNRSGDCL